MNTIAITEQKETNILPIAKKEFQISEQNRANIDTIVEICKLRQENIINQEVFEILLDSLVASAQTTAMQEIAAQIVNEFAKCITENLYHMFKNFSQKLIEEINKGIENGKR